MALLDVNALVALAWDSHIHHVRIREWFATNASQGWATCPITESGFVRVSTNPKVLPSPIGVADARRVLATLREADGGGVWALPRRRRSEFAHERRCAA